MAREGYPFIGGALVVALVTFYFSVPVGLVMLILPSFIAYFFRDPKRVTPEDPALVISPADGKVIEVGEVEETRYLKKRMKKIVIFLSIFNVHVNRVPCSGRVKAVVYHPGKFLIGFHKKASLDNEQNAILIEPTPGRQLLFIQIAGFIARRIICYLHPGDQVKGGDRFGLIRFGSRMDLYLPLDCTVMAKVGDRVKGGESILGRWSS